jgi:hypothetical protein
LRRPRRDFRSRAEEMPWRRRFTLFGEFGRDGRGAGRHRPSRDEEQCCRFESRSDHRESPLGKRCQDRYLSILLTKCQPKQATPQWPTDMRLSDIEPRFVCTACGKTTKLPAYFDGQQRRAVSRCRNELFPFLEVLFCLESFVQPICGKVGHSGVRSRSASASPRTFP